jgi:zinc transport system permease protein
MTGIIVPMMYDLAIPSGGAIVLSAAIFFIVTSIIRSFSARFREAGV